MLRLTVTSKHPPAEIMRRARAFFGAGGVGLEPSDGATGISFTGAGGFVTVVLADEDGKTLVDLSTREFDHQVRRFARAIR
jgi:hypothetical protein